jgi:surfactin synthase thioesterase subunit
MDAMTFDRWVPFRNEGAFVRCRLFCFPHAGGNASFYWPLRRFMPCEIDFCPLELPGRAARLDEAPIASMSALMERLYHALRPLMAVPFGFFGHSVGAYMAFEAARQARSITGRSAAHLFVSGRESPNVPSIDCTPARPRSDQDLIAILSYFGGTPAAIMQRPELIAAVLPALRADLALVEGYTADRTDRITCPITAFGGTDDISHTGSLQSWKDFTLGTFRTCTFPGGHFYFSPLADMLAKEIVHDLRASMGMHATDLKSQI